MTAEPKTGTTDNLLNSNLPKESTDALIRSAVALVRAEASIEVSVTLETFHGRTQDFQRFVVALPSDADPEQRAEADYWLNEVLPLFRYAGE